MEPRSAAQKTENPKSNRLIWPVAVALIALLGCTPGTRQALAKVFTQETYAFDSAGQPLPKLVIDPDTWENLLTLHYDLGAERELEVRTNLAAFRVSEVDSLAAVVRRCYGHLESATGREISGGVLLYLLQFEDRPRTYRFESNTGETDQWCQVRLAMLDTGQPVLGAGASHHVTEFIYDTLPHELTHGLLTCVPTVRHDRDGQASQGTRWFIDGTCEMLAKDFAATEAPDFWHGALAVRGIGPGRGRPELYDLVWDWGQASQLSWTDESDLYGVSLLLVTAWTNVAALSNLLDMMAGRGGDHHGGDLRDMLLETANLTAAQLEQAARELGRQTPRSAELSLRQLP